MDYILNGQAQGNVAATLLSSGFDVKALRPYVGKDGRSYITRNEAGKDIAVPCQNANATLIAKEWIQIDTAVIQAVRARLRFVADLRAAGLTYTIPNGMGKTVLESQTVSDITGATVSMDPARVGEADRLEFGLVHLPLPVIHKDFHFTARQIAVSRNGGSPLDTTMAELSARKVAEEAEKMALGLADTITYGGGTIYGLTNFPQRITVTMTSPESSHWTPATTVAEVLQLRKRSHDALHFGPWVLYVSSDWDLYLDTDYSTLKGDNSLRQRLATINGVTDIRSLDYLTGYQMILVQMTSDVIREVIGMDVTTVQWESLGGMVQHFKVMAIMVPQLRSVTDGAHAGIVHGAVP